MVAFLTNFIWSRLIVRCTNRLVLSSTPFEPLRGVLVSFKNRIVATNTITSTNVFHINVTANQITDNNHKNRRPQSLDSGPEDPFLAAGRVGNFSGSEACRVQARRRDMREAPSPTEWWIRNIATASASEVRTLRRWSSHNGLEISRGVVVIWEM